jgi:uncharacterized protein YecT (DUF1311 family)
MPKKLVDLEVKAVAAVDKAANKRRFLIVKRADEQKPNSFKEWLIKTFQKKEDGPIAFSTALNSSRLDDEWWRLNDALRTSVRSIIGSEAEGKKELVQTAVQEFGEALVSLIAKKDLQPDLQKVQDNLILIGDLLEKEDAFDEVMDCIKNIEGEVETFKKSMEGDGNMPNLDELLKATPQELQDAVKAELAKKDEEIAKLKGDNQADEGIEKSALPEDVRKRFEELEKRAEEAEKIAKAEREARIKADIRKKAEGYANAGSVDDIAEIMFKAQDVSEEFAKKIEGILSAANERIAKGKLFAENGHSDSGSSTAYEQLMAKAAEIRKNDSALTKEQAFDKATDIYPDLVAEYRKEAF